MTQENRLVHNFSDTVTQPIIRNIRMHTLLLTITLIACPLLAHTDVDTVKQEVFTILKKTNPRVLPRMQEYDAQYAESVRVFFDKKNKQPLAEHCKRMKAELELLQNVCSDHQFASVRHLLLENHRHLTEFYTTVKSYIGSHNTLGFALALRKYRFLLTGKIKTRSIFYLFGCLSHRLSC